MQGRADDIFRAEALRYHVEPSGSGAVLRISPRWVSWTYWLLALILVASTVFAIAGTVDEYATGPAVVRIDGRIDITARAAGTVAEVRATPGQRVHAGDVLVAFDPAPEDAALARVAQEFDLQLVKLLRDPADQVARAALTSLRAQRELARAHVAERSVRAPRDGVVSDVRIHPGQHLAPGDRILTLVGEGARYSVVAMLPGHTRPLLRHGLPLRLELAGFRYAYQDLAIDAIGDEVVGPAEVRRFLGPDLADTVTLDGPVVLVTARLPGSMFSARGQTFRYYDGMPAQTEARTRRESVLLTLVPGLRYVFGGGSD